MKKPIAGGVAGAAGVEVALPASRTFRSPRIAGILESERLLAAVLLDSPAHVLVELLFDLEDLHLVVEHLEKVAHEHLERRSLEERLLLERPDHEMSRDQVCRA